jgi:large-conductance mechanosensitive channel
MSTTFELLTKFLERPTDSILAVASAMAIGASFKELITSIVNNFVQPLLYLLLIQVLDIQKLPILKDFFSQSNGIIEFSNLIISVVSFLFIVLTVFYIVQIINNVTKNHLQNLYTDENANKKSAF